MGHFCPVVHPAVSTKERIIRVMSGQDNLQFVWDIMLQSEWWKQYGEMIERSQADKPDPMSNAGSDNAETYMSSAWVVPVPSSWSGSVPSSWTGPVREALFGSSAETWWNTSSETWWMEIPEAWWSSFGGVWWSSFPGSEEFGSGCGLGYGLQLI